MGEIEKVIRELGWEVPLENINIKYIPDDTEMANVKEIGYKLGEYIKG